jgi:hypothetical protein
MRSIVYHSADLRPTNPGSRFDRFSIAGPTENVTQPQELCLLGARERMFFEPDQREKLAAALEDGETKV